MITRLCGIAAMFAGLLRATASFIPETAANVHVLYLFTDLLLFIAVIGLYRSSVVAGNIVGRLGFAIMCIALVVLIGRDVGTVAAGAYAGAAAVFSLGLVLISIQALRVRKIPSWIPISWILSTTIGPVGFFVPKLSVLFVMAGLLFGIAFMGAGVVLWRLDVAGGKSKGRL